MPDTSRQPILRVERLCTVFAIRRRLFGGPPRLIHAVNDVSFELPRGGVLGIVGESGCGKSTLARTILRLTPAHSGRVLVDGVDVLRLNSNALRRLRRRVQIVFQDPVGSLNPRLTVNTIVGEALLAHGLERTRRAVRERVAALLRRVGLAPDDQWRYPHEFSGGQRQRIGIARALALEPELLVLDEPTSALDVSVQAQILNLLAELRASLGLSYLFISHNLAVVRHVCDAVAVMYLGRIVEQAPTELLFSNPRHPYTRALLAAAPRTPDEASAQRAARATTVVRGEPPDPANPTSGCPYRVRCPLAADVCARELPVLGSRPGLLGGHVVACHFGDKS